MTGLGNLPLSHLKEDALGVLRERRRDREDHRYEYDRIVDETAAAPFLRLPSLGHPKCVFILIKRERERGGKKGPFRGFLPSPSPPPSPPPCLRPPACLQNAEPNCFFLPSTFPLFFLAFSGRVEVLHGRGGQADHDVQGDRGLPHLLHQVQRQ